MLASSTCSTPGLYWRRVPRSSCCKWRRRAPRAPEGAAGPPWLIFYAFSHLPLPLVVADLNDWGNSVEQQLLIVQFSKSFNRRTGSNCWLKSMSSSQLPKHAMSKYGFIWQTPNINRQRKQTSAVPVKYISKGTNM